MKEEMTTTDWIKWGISFITIPFMAIGCVLMVISFLFSISSIFLLNKFGFEAKHFNPVTRWIGDISSKFLLR